MEKLISTTNFVLNQYHSEYDYQTSFINCVKYVEFIKQPLTLGMFIPVDRDGRPFDLKEVESWKNHYYFSRFYKEEFSFLEEAKEKVLFENFEIIKSKIDKGFDILRIKGQNKIWAEIKKGRVNFKHPNVCNPTVEDLICDHIILTESALKQIGIK